MLYKCQGSKGNILLSYEYWELKNWLLWQDITGDNSGVHGVGVINHFMLNLKPIPQEETYSCYF